MPTLTIDHFLDDPHAVRYRDQLDAHREAIAHLLDLLNDPDSERRLIDAEANHDQPALSGVVRSVESDDVVRRVLDDEAAGRRFRQTVGVAVKLKMNQLGWVTTGRKGSVVSQRFGKAERYAPGGPDRVVDRARRALASVSAIGDDDERRTTGDILQTSLVASRAADDRPF